MTEEEKARLLKRATEHAFVLEHRLFGRDWVKLYWYDKWGFFLTDTGFQRYTVSDLLSPTMEIRVYEP